MVQIRDVPDDVHTILKTRAAREGMSLSDFINRELEHTAKRPSMQGVAGIHAAGETDCVEVQFRATNKGTTRFKVIVLDASAVVELLTNGELSDSLRRAFAIRSDAFIVPDLVDVEVASALRRLVAVQRIDSHRTEQFLVGLAMFPPERYPHMPLLPRMWELRHNFTCYDAAYIALAEATDSTLYTCDTKLSKGHRARVSVFTK